MSVKKRPCVLQPALPTRNKGASDERASELLLALKRPERGCLSVLMLTWYHAVIYPSPCPQGGTIIKHANDLSLSMSARRRCAALAHGVTESRNGIDVEHSLDKLTPSLPSGGVWS